MDPSSPRQILTKTEQAGLHGTTSLPFSGFFQPINRFATRHIVLTDRYKPLPFLVVTRKIMLQQLRKMIESFSREKPDNRSGMADEARLAAAALLVHAMLIDGTRDEAEMRKLKELLAKNYHLKESETEELIDLATREDSRAVDLYGFTRRLNRDLDHEERLKIIEMLWEMAYADGVLHEFEENLVWLVAELVHIEPRERIRLKQIVRSKLEKS